MKAVVWDEETLGAKYSDTEIPADLLDQAKEYREKMIEAAVELDDDAMTAYLEGNEPDEATLKRLIRKATITGAFYPVLCGSAFKNKASAAARCRCRLSAVTDRRSANQRHRRRRQRDRPSRG